MKAIVLVSGGVDSTTCLAIAVARYGAENVIALSLKYGQKHSARELKASVDVCNYYGVLRIEKDISDVFEMSNCSLLAASTREIIHKSYAEQLAENPGTVDTYVPFRNGTFLSIAAAYALSLGAGCIFYGAHADDAAGRAYPDCTPEFVDAMRTAIYEGSGHVCTLQAPFIHFTKAQIVGKGLLLNVPYTLTWSCYEGGNRPCGTCGTCIDRIAAFKANGVKDPIEYSVEVVK